MSKKHTYEVNVQWKEGRIGTLSSPVLNEIIECATPPEFPNGVPNIWSPEHLYAAAISSCYMATFLAIAANFKLSFSGFSCKTTCKLEVIEGKSLITEAVIKPVVTLTDRKNDEAKAFRVFERSKVACLITNSMKTDIHLEGTVQ